MTLKLPPRSVTAPSWDADPVGWAEWYLRENAHVYREFRRLVLASIQHHPSMPISADQVLHVIRWNSRVSARGDLFAINNNASALFARLFLEEHPQHRALFRTRRSVLDDLDAESWRRLMVAFEPLRTRRGPA